MKHFSHYAKFLLHIGFMKAQKTLQLFFLMCIFSAVCQHFESFGRPTEPAVSPCELLVKTTCSRKHHGSIAATKPTFPQLQT